MNRLFMVLVTVALSSLAPAKLCAQSILHYTIQPGSQYTFKPSPFVPIPGGQPSEFQLDFGVSGLLTLEWNGAASPARILNADLLLSGNEAIQNSPPPFSPVTAEGVASYLEARLFNQTPVTDAYVEYVAQQPTGLRVRDFQDGQITLTGGFDGTFVDGFGMLFNVSAALVPEPSTLALAGSSLFALSLLRRRRQRESPEPVAGCLAAN
jgi:hypothetical protein